MSLTSPIVAPEIPLDVAAAAEFLNSARLGHRARMLDFPLALRPVSARQAYAIQDAVVQARGPVVGWKVGAPTPQAQPVRAALTADTVVVAASDAPVALPSERFFMRGVEAEWVYEMGADLPVRERPYTAEEVLGAVTSVRAAIEVCDTRFAAWAQQGEWSMLADQACHGALVVGAKALSPAHVRAADQAVQMRINGDPAVAHPTWSNPAGDPLRLLLWLANEGASSLGGLRAGHWVTTGSCTGSVLVAPGARVEAAFSGLGQVVLALG